MARMRNRDPLAAIGGLRSPSSFVFTRYFVPAGFTPASNSLSSRFDSSDQSSSWSASMTASN